MQMGAISKFRPVLVCRSSSVLPVHVAGTGIDLYVRCTWSVAEDDPTSNFLRTTTRLALRHPGTGGRWRGRTCAMLDLSNHSSRSWPRSTPLSQLHRGGVTPGVTATHTHNKPQNAQSRRAGTRRVV